MNLLIPVTKIDDSPFYEPNGEQLMASSAILKSILKNTPKTVAELQAMASLAGKIQSSPEDFTPTVLEKKMLTEAIKFSGSLVKRAIELENEQNL